MKTIEETIKKTFKIKANVVGKQTSIINNDHPIHTLYCVDEQNQEFFLIVNEEFLKQSIYKSSSEITINVSF